jgi:NADH-quinone oxidoreductase subunit E
MAVRRLAEIQPESFEFTPEKPAIEKVAEILGMPDIRVLEIATFYSMFNLKPVGKYFIQMCGTTPCVLRGSDGIKAVLEQRIGAQDHVTPDGLFSWLEVECLGACCNAPMVQINDDYFEDLTPENTAKLLDDLAAGRPVKVGSQTGRKTSEPSTGLTSLTGLYGQDGQGGSFAASHRTGGTPPAAAPDQDNAAPHETSHGGLDMARENTTAKPQGSIENTGTRTDVPVGANQAESGALTQDAPQQAKERQEVSGRENPPVPGPAGNTK